MQAIQLRTAIAHAFIAILFFGIVALYLVSLFSVMYVAGDAWVIGMFAFLVAAAAHNLRRGSWFALRPVELPGLWKVCLPLCFILFAGFMCSIVTLGGTSFVGFSGPEIGSEPILASRDQYLFHTGVERPRWRFVLAALSFNLIWHLFGIAFALDDWLGVVRERVNGRPGVAPPGRSGALKGDWRQLRRLAAGARKGRLSRTHVKRMRRLVYFVQSSAPFVYLLAVIAFLAIVGVVTGVLGTRAIGVPVGLAFFVVWLGFALDLVLSIWEKSVLDSIWMALWVSTWGAVTLAVIWWVVVGG